MLWDLFHPMHTIGPVILLVEYSHTVGISSTRMAAFATFVGPVNDNTGNATFPTGAEFVTFVGRPFPFDEALQHFLPRWSTLQVNDDQSDLDAVTTVAFTVDSPLPRLSGSL
ncbi:hypothetical protein BGY98DRAFT_1192759, partial [Russula aff. rugulosa BPL654]